MIPCKYARNPSTGGYQSWKTFKTIVSLNKGKAKIRLIAPSGGFNINWLRIADHQNTVPVCSLGDDKEIVLPYNATPNLQPG
jgi:hypothetical protein